MACSNQPGPAALRAYVKAITGESFKQSEWHALKERAREEGMDTSRTRLTLDEKRALHEHLADRMERQFTLQDDFPTADRTLEKALEKTNVTRGTRAIINRLIDGDVRETLADIRGEKTDTAGYAEDEFDDNAAEAALANAEMQFDAQAERVADAVGINFGVAADLLWNSPELYDEVTAGELTHQRRIEIVKEGYKVSSDERAERILEAKAQAWEAEYAKEVAEELRAQQYDGLTDLEADADTLASAGWGTDEDYGYYGGNENH